MKRVVALALVLVAAAGCDGGDGEARRPPSRVVEGDYDTVVVRSGGETERFPPGDLLPLLAARSFPPAEPLREYGLHRPRARLVYEPDGPTVLVGGFTVDGAFRYVMVAGDDTIHTVPADVLAQRVAPR